MAQFCKFDLEIAFLGPCIICAQVRPYTTFHVVFFSRRIRLISRRLYECSKICKSLEDHRGVDVPSKVFVLFVPFTH